MIKTLLFTCLVASAKADADADAAYLAYGYGHPYAYAGVPFGSSSGLDPITQGLDPVTQGALPYAGYAGYYGHYISKRSADADAYYAAYPYAAPVAYAAAVHFGSSTGLDPITQGLDAVTQGVAIPAYGHFLGKRSADADADAFYGYPYAGYSAYHYGAPAYSAYAYGAYPYAAAVPFGSSTGLDPITQGLDAVTQGAVVYGK